MRTQQPRTRATSVCHLILAAVLLAAAGNVAAPAIASAQARADQAEPGAKPQPAAETTVANDAAADKPSLLAESLERLQWLALLLAAVVIVLARLPKIKDVDHSQRFRRRRVFNWLPLGLTYAFLYMGRYNLKISKFRFEELPSIGGGVLMDNEAFSLIFMVGTIVYGFSFLINGPLTDRLGGRFSILMGAGGAAVCNVAMGLATWTLVANGPGASFVAAHFLWLFAVLYGGNMYFQSFGAVAIVKCNAPWFHVRERGVFGAIFGILIALGVYFAFDWGRLILDYAGLVWVFFVPAILLGLFFLIDAAVVHNSPADAGLDDFDTADASSGDDGPRLSAVEVFKRMLGNPIIVTIAMVEFCSGFLRQAIMQWYRTYAKQTNDVLDLQSSVVYEHWGLMLCCAGILGGVFAGVISDRVFQSRRGPVAAVLYTCMAISALAMTFVYDTPVVSFLVLFMSLAIIGVHGMLSGTASMDFGGRKNVGVAVGIIDGFVYLGTATMAGVYSILLPNEHLDEAGKLAGAATDPANWRPWPLSMLVMSIVGLVLARRLWNAKPQPSRLPQVPKATDISRAA